MQNWILAGLTALLLAGCSDSNQANQPATTPQPASAASSEAAPAEPAAPTHYYVVEEDGQYGYEAGISEDDQKAGKVAADITMVRYMGVIKGYHTLQSVKNGVTTTLRCKEPCDFAKVNNSMGNVSADPETMRLAAGSLGWAMTRDALSGQLKVWKKD